MAIKRQSMAPRFRLSSRTARVRCRLACLYPRRIAAILAAAKVRTGLACLLLGAIAALLSACSGGISVGAAPVTEQWTPPYLELHLLTGKAQIQWADES